ncbi:MAG: recombinase family protein, partial [Vibrionaceae bacterium]
MIYAYLRASTLDQDATRAYETISEFCTNYCQCVDLWVVENASGTTLERPKLNKMLDSMNAGDILLIEQVDRLTRLQAEDWRKLKRTIEDKRINIVSLDLPTSYEALKTPQGLTLGFLGIINNMLLDILALTARKDYEDRRRRQAEGIKKAIAQGKYKGRQPSPEVAIACLRALELVVIGVKKFEAAKAVGISTATFYRYLKKVN